MPAGVYEIFTIYYDPEFNLFEDENGEIVYDIFNYLSPNELMLLKEKRGTIYKNGPIGVMYEIVAPLDMVEAQLFLTRVWQISWKEN